MPPNTPYPPLLVDWLTPMYDLFVRLLLREEHLKRRLIAMSDIQPGHRVLDLGAGTGTLAIMIARAQPEARVTGLDADARALARAHRKAAPRGAAVSWARGDATCLPYAAASFDRVVSTLVLSLLTRAAKAKALHEAHRALRAGGEVHIADFGPPATRWGQWLARRMRRFEPMADHLDGRLPSMVRAAGFQRVAERGRVATALGTLAILSGRKEG